MFLKVFFKRLCKPGKCAHSFGLVIFSIISILIVCTGLKYNFNYIMFSDKFDMKTGCKYNESNCHTPGSVCDFLGLLVSEI